MANTRDPILKPIPILSLRPTQMTVGMREVKEKRKRWREQKSEKKRAELLGKHMIPVVLGPDEHYYVVDHHHLARALHDEGVKDILVTVIGDLTMVDREAFWGVMDTQAMGLSLRRQGRAAALQGHAEIGSRPHGRSVPQPRRRIAPHRRLRQGHHAVQRILWADFLRRKISRKSVEEISTRRSRRRWRCAKSKDAVYLPGWCGPVD